MIRVTVHYPKTADSHFDLDYYVNSHLPMVKERLAPLGLLRIGCDEGLAGLAPNESATHAVIGYLVFNSVEDLQKGLAAHGQEIMADIPNYTNVQPQIQINRVAAEL